MDKEEFEKIKRLSDNATEEIKRLQEEILRYKSGAESFAEATSAIKELAEKQEAIIRGIREYVEGISKLDFEKVFREEYGRMKQMSEKLEKNISRFEKAQRGLEETREEIKRLEEKMAENIQENNRETRREIRKMKEEITEKVAQDKKRGFRLFGKK